MELLKVCTNCQQKRDLLEFHRGTSLHGRKSQCIECCRRHYNPEKAKIAKNACYERNKDKHQKIIRAYKESHRAECTAREAFRRAQKLKATPPWLTKEHKKQIENLYKLREKLTVKTGIIHHVDHIVPLINKNVCGLHVPWNLRVIPGLENLKKSNKVEI